MSTWAAPKSLTPIIQFQSIEFSFDKTLRVAKLDEAYFWATHADRTRIFLDTEYLLCGSDLPSANVADGSRPGIALTSACASLTSHSCR